MTGSAPVPAGNATAHVYWDRAWSTADGRQRWSDPDPFVAERLPDLVARGAVRGLDLGCGPGRHAVAMAAAGLHALAVDASPTALMLLGERVASEDLTVETIEATMTELPVPDASIDVVVAFNVVYHGDRGDARRAIAEVARVLRPGGVYLSTMLSKRHRNFGRGVEVSPDTFVDTSGRHVPGMPDDKAHPHLYCDAADLVALHAGLAATSLQDLAQSGEGTNHWYCVFERRLTTTAGSDNA
ncbi:MAG: class I SAM-dependent methyltransferase [Nocardioides sp.]|uniref:class I SAM-dependent methyltransferase n=1 Tax=Nocardioides sp. TaxID=35761 RepID=UPI0039E59C57